MNIFNLFFINNIASYSSNIDNSLDYSGLLSLIFYFFAFIVILILAFFSTKLWARKSKFGAKGKNMEILDAMSIGSNSKIIIAQILNKVYIISVSNSSITLIDKLGDVTELDELSEQNNPNLRFTDYFEKILGSSNGKENENNSVEPNKKLLNILNKVSLLNKKTNEYTVMDEDEDEDEEKNYFKHK